MPTGFVESVAEQAALARLESLGYAVLHGPDIGFSSATPERSDTNYRDVILEARLRQRSRGSTPLCRRRRSRTRSAS